MYTAVGNVRAEINSASTVAYNGSHTHRPHPSNKQLFYSTVVSCVYCRKECVGRSQLCVNGSTYTMLATPMDHTPKANSYLKSTVYSVYCHRDCVGASQRLHIMLSTPTDHTPITNNCLTVLSAVCSICHTQ